VLKREGTEAVIGLITEDEMRSLEVEGIAEACGAAGVEYIHEPIMDEGVPSPAAVDRLAKRLDDLLEQEAPTVIHCVGGLGRTGTVACMALIRHGASADEALKAVRAARGPEAVENDLQEEFVRSYSA
jgi:protein-tyrosine phosphatase